MAQGAVQGGEGFVQQDKGRGRGQGAGQGRALLLPAGELVRVAPFESPEAGQAQRLGHVAAAALGAGQAEADVALDGQVREQRAVLRDVADVPGLGGDVQAGCLQHAAVEQDAAAIRGLKPGDQPQQRRLAAAGGAEQGDDVAGGDGEVDPAQHLAPAPELAEAFNDQACHRARRRVRMVKI